MDDVPLPERRGTQDDGVCEEACSRPDGHPSADDGIRTDLDVSRELGARIDDAGGVNARCHRRLPVSIENAREELSLRAERPVYTRLSLQLPDICPVVNDRDFEVKPIPGSDRAAELGLVDAEEIHERIACVEGLAGVGENASDLCERLEDQDAGQDGASREVPEEP